MTLKWNHNVILGITDEETVKLDFDDTPLRTVKYWVFRTMNWFKLEGFVIFKSSEKKYPVELDGNVVFRSSKKSYLVVFNRKVSWRKNVHIMAWVAIESQIPKLKDKNEHLIFWDLEPCSLEEAVEKLSQVQFEFKLGDIFITSDANRSYRAWCFSRRTFLEYIHILIHTFPLVDFGFFIWTVRRTAGTLRISGKQGRPPQEVVACLKGYEETEIPEKMVHVIYDTGIEKKGRVIGLG